MKGIKSERVKIVYDPDKDGVIEINKKLIEGKKLNNDTRYISVYICVNRDGSLIELKGMAIYVDTLPDDIDICYYVTDRKTYLRQFRMWNSRQSKHYKKDLALLSDDIPGIYYEPDLEKEWYKWKTEIVNLFVATNPYVPHFVPLHDMNLRVGPDLSKPLTRARIMEILKEDYDE